jgi:uncharacterized membrane protein
MIGSIGISFQTALWWGWAALATVAAAVVLLWLYRRLFTLYPKQQAGLLAGLKIAAVGVLLMSLLRPALFHESKNLADARLILLVDDSRSMTTRDGAIGQPRIDDARKLAFDTILPRMKDRLMVTTLSFAEGVKTLDKAEQLTGKGEGTDIPNALLESAKSYVKSGSIGAYLLVTDGGDARTLPPALSVGAPVFSLAIGTDLSKADDLRIGQVDYPERVDSKTEFDVKVECSAVGRTEFFDQIKNLSLSLSEGGKQISANVVRITQLERRDIITLRVNAGDPGIHRYLLKLPTFKTEIATLNNERTFTVEVQDPSLRVLYFASKLGQGYKPLRNALKSDPGLHITGLLRVGADRFLLQGERPDDKLPNEFPTNVDTLKKFRCIVLNDCEAKDMSPAGMKALEQFVSEGGAVVFIGGPSAYGVGGWAPTVLAPVFPWQVAASEPAYKSESIQVELTPLGRAHAIFRDLSAAMGTASVSKMNGYNSPGSLRPGAQGLVQGALASGERPAVVAFTRYGKGKVLGIATHAMWLWSEQEAEGGKAYSAFWRQAVRFLTGSEDGGGLLNLTADRLGRYAPGSRATVTARVLDKGLAPLKGAILNATLKKLDGSIVSAINFRDDGPPGSYSAQIDLAAAGAYRLQVSASDSKGLLETREILLEAGAGTGEGAFPAVNTSYLTELANKTGGACLPQDKADELLSKIVEGVKAEVRRREISLLWDQPWYFFLFLTLMTCEWIARRRMNMI